MANSTIGALFTANPLTGANVDGDLDSLAIYDVSAGTTKGISPRELHHGSLWPTTLSVTSNFTLAGTLSVSSTLSVSGISTFSSALRAADGSAAAPSYSFTNETGMGLYRRASNALDVAIDGRNVLDIQKSDAFGDYLGLGNGARIGWTSTIGAENSPDLVLRRDAANTLAQRNGTAAQAFRIYNTFTDASNYERGILIWSSNVLVLGTQQAGTGVSRPLYFQTAGTSRWSIDTSGHIAALSDNTYDIGASGANRPRTGYFGTSLSVIGTVSGTGVVAVGNGTAPTAQTDTVALYSTDNAAGNTIPSFFCEGTDVLATGQADSASSVRVRMRINGTVVTLLAI